MDVLTEVPGQVVFSRTTKN